MDRSSNLLTSTFDRLDYFQSPQNIDFAGFLFFRSTGFRGKKGCCGVKFGVSNSPKCTDLLPILWKQIALRDAMLFICVEV